MSVGTTTITHPNGGMGPKLWTGNAAIGYSLIARPSSPVVLRFYRTQEGYTYTDPRCVAGMAPVSLYLPKGNPGHAVMPSTDPTNPNKVFSNYSAIIIKRVSSTTWLELRWYALNHAKALDVNPSAISPPFAFELWCSHDVSGTLATTKLAAWDYSSVNGVGLQNTPLRAATQPMYLEATLLDNNVSWGLWSEYPGSLTVPADSSSRLESGKYPIPVALQSIVGSAAAGQPGIKLFVDNGVTGNYPPTGSPVWARMARNVPFVHFMEFSKANFQPASLDIPVLGDADDTPPVIKIYGRIVNPLVVLLVPNDDGTYTSHRIILEGEVGLGDVLTIDLADDGSIIDAQGNNRYDMLRSGSRLPMLRPGLNKVSLSAIDWDESRPEHMSVAWRDALS
jgi:hypothetical protein